MAGRAILLKHMLRAIPAYHLMILELQLTGYRELEKIYRRFLWGSSQAKGNKKALIAWKDIIDWHHPFRRASTCS